MQLLTLLLFAVSISIDGLALGTSYGIRKMLIPVYCKILLGTASASALFIAMVSGQILLRVMPSSAGLKFSSLIMLLLGCYILLKPGDGEKVNFGGSGSIGIINSIIAVIKDKRNADLDNSGQLSFYEAVILGAALSLDAFTVGIGASLAGFDPFVTPILAGFMQLIFFTSGINLGERLGSLSKTNKFSKCSGCIMIFIGLVKMLQ